MTRENTVPQNTNLLYTVVCNTSMLTTQWLNILRPTFYYMYSQV